MAAVGVRGARKNAIALIDSLEDAFSTELAQQEDDNPWLYEPLPLYDFLKDHLKLELWPAQRQDFEAFLGSTVEETKRIFTQTPPTPYNCGALIYGKGSGKDLISSATLVWFIHVLLCLKHPQSFLGLEASEAIDIAIASPTLRQTRRITFTKFKNRLKGWRWLRDRCEELGIANPDRYLEKATEAADFVELPHQIRIHNLPLDSASTEGFNLIAFILSEYAALESEAKGESATAVFETFVSSGRTRFQKAWKGFLAAYPRSTNDPQEKLVEAQEAGQFPELYVVRRATWEVHPHRSFDDFANDFARNPEDSWAKYGARPRAAVESYFRSPELIVKNASGGDFGLFQKYFPSLNPDTIQKLCDRVPDPVVERDLLGDIVLNQFGFPQLHPWFRGIPDRAYYGHIDVGLKHDSLGLTIGHLEPEPNSDRVLPVVDLMIRWTAAHFTGFGDIKRFNWHGTGYYSEHVEAAEIDLKTIADFCIWLKTARGFVFENVSCDGFNSAMLMQSLQQAEIPCSLHIADKSDYDELKGSIYQRQLQYRCDRIIFHELNKLEIRNGKVEAPRTKAGDGTGPDSHKDLADSLAVVVAYLCRLAIMTTEFVQLPEIDTEKTDGSITVNKASEEFNQTQKQLLADFLSGD